MPALLPTSFFSLMKRTKNQVSKNASFRTWPMRCKLDKTWAANNCAPATPARCLRFSKYLLCPATRKATLFCPISAEAVLLPAGLLVLRFSFEVQEIWWLAIVRLRTYAVGASFDQPLSVGNILRLYHARYCIA